MTDQATQDPLKKMREAFPENQISKLPKPMLKREQMDKLPKAKCSICGGYHATSNVMHLDYVGHAAITNRLLDADPSWSWEPFATDENGLPMLDANKGLWIRLTVGGVTRIGYGDAPNKAGGDAMKEAIGDAIRNAAMRFGAALELWHKGDLFADEHDEDAAPEAPKEPQKPTVTDERFQVGLASIKAGSYSKERMIANYSLTDAQMEELNAL